ncbi:hypothetical protein [Agromyces cerinus]|uniref:PsbP protein n=1 Tax=Agromyces cerinus subsp. cerinus TaxID=232089 RepID=A0A1N6E2R9_9MICO|nr:hypothetical protein [Agromyces cerinus]SIN77281.1 hypothetical protein SAMN05443544_1015 [Agromyces cerinus subsp. cerinus]
MPRFIAPVALAVAASLALAGCSSNPGNDSPSASEAQEPTAAPATGVTIEGSGYAFVAPEGWEVPADFSLPGADVIVADLTDSDGFADNVNVFLSPAGELTPERVESMGVVELEGAGATEVTVRERIAVSGSESPHISAGLSSNDADYLIEQYYVTQDGQTYVVTFSFSPTVSQPDRDELSESVLATWDWA